MNVLPGCMLEASLLQSDSAEGSSQILGPSLTGAPGAVDLPGQQAGRWLPERDALPRRQFDLQEATWLGKGRVVHRAD